MASNAQVPFARTRTMGGTDITGTASEHYVKLKKLLKFRGGSATACNECDDITELKLLGIKSGVLKIEEVAEMPKEKDKMKQKLVNDLCRVASSKQAPSRAQMAEAKRKIQLGTRKHNGYVEPPRNHMMHVHASQEAARRQASPTQPTSVKPPGKKLPSRAEMVESKRKIMESMRADKDQRSQVATMADKGGSQVATMKRTNSVSSHGVTVTRTDSLSEYTKKGGKFSEIDGDSI